jgi:drug/metabolite transporter (DMT)-like permease
MWYLIIVLYVLNGVLDFTAFAFAPLSLIAPTSAVTIVINAVLAWVFFEERVTRTNIVGIALIMIGAIVAIWSGSHQAADRDIDGLLALYKRDEFLAFFSGDVFFIVVSTLLILYLDVHYRGMKSGLNRLFPFLFKQAAVSSSLKAQSLPTTRFAPVDEGGEANGNDDDDDDNAFNGDGSSKKKKKKKAQKANERGDSENASMLRVDSGRGGLSSMRNGGAGNGNGSQHRAGSGKSHTDTRLQSESPLAADEIQLDILPEDGQILTIVNDRRDSASDVAAAADAFVTPSKQGRSASGGSDNGRSRLSGGNSTPTRSRGVTDSQSFSLAHTPLPQTSAFGERLSRNGNAALNMRAISYAWIGASVTSWTNILGKSMSEIIKTSIKGDNQFDQVLAYLLIVLVIFSAFAQLKLMTLMMNGFESVFIIPIYQCLFIILLILFGLVYFDEFGNVETAKIIVFFLAICVCIGGLYLTAKRPPVHDMAREEKKKMHLRKKTTKQTTRDDSGNGQVGMNESQPLQLATPS